jgi:hypothetical protein
LHDRCSEETHYLRFLGVRLMSIADDSLQRCHFFDRSPELMERRDQPSIFLWLWNVAEEYEHRHVVKGCYRVLSARNRRWPAKRSTCSYIGVTVVFRSPASNGLPTSERAPPR